MNETDADDVRHRLAGIEERINRISLRMSAGYGSDSDREGWLLWLRQLRTRRDALRQVLEATGDAPSATDASRAD